MIFVAAPKLSDIVWTPIRYVTFHFRDQRGAAARRSFAPLQKSRHHNRSFVWIEALSDMIFVAARKLSVIAWTPMRYVTFHFRDQRSFAPLQKSHCHNRSFVWTEALFDMIFVAAQKLSVIVWTQPKARNVFVIESDRIFVLTDQSDDPLSLLVNSTTISFYRKKEVRTTNLLLQAFHIVQRYRSELFHYLEISPSKILARVQNKW